MNDASNASEDRVWSDSLGGIKSLGLEDEEGTYLSLVLLFFSSTTFFWGGEL